MAESEFLQILLLFRKKRTFIYSKIKVNKERKSAHENVWPRTVSKEGVNSEKVK